MPLYQQVTGQLAQSATTGRVLVQQLYVHFHLADSIPT